MWQRRRALLHVKFLTNIQAFTKRVWLPEITQLCRQMSQEEIWEEIYDNSDSKDDYLESASEGIEWQKSKPRSWMQGNFVNRSAERTLYVTFFENWDSEKEFYWFRRRIKLMTGNRWKNSHVKNDRYTDMAHLSGSFIHITASLLAIPRMRHLFVYLFINMK